VQILRSVEAAAANPAPSVVTIGAFDGIHLAHRELLRLVRERAARSSAASVAVTFDPHPARVLAPQKAPKLLTPTPFKIELLAASGIDRLLILPFTRDFSLWPPEKFVQEVLVKALRATVVVVGDNFRFGYRAAGDVTMLAELGKRWGFDTQVLPTIHIRRLPVSSSQIRSLLDAGDVSRANRLLGRPFSIRNHVEPGLGIGRAKTVPTLNLAPYAEFLPATGVYVTQTRVIETRDSPNDASLRNPESGIRNGLLEASSASSGSHSPLTTHNSPPFRSVTNVGYRPTFGEHSLGVETHLIDPFGTPTSCHPEERSDEGPALAPSQLPAPHSPNVIEIFFLYRLRDERKFDSAEQLKSQILRDIRRAESYFRRLSRSTSAMRSEPGA